MTNKKFFTVTYEVEGSINTDTLMVWASNITEAIEEFIKTPITTYSIKITYTQYAIKKIEC